MNTLNWVAPFEFHYDVCQQKRSDEPYFALIVDHLKRSSQIPTDHGHDSYAVVVADAAAVDVAVVVTAGVVAVVGEIHVS